MFFNRKKQTINYNPPATHAMKKYPTRMLVKMCQHNKFKTTYKDDTRSSNSLQLMQSIDCVTESR